MSSAVSPEETPDDASPAPSDGGSSKQFTQGEIIFATLLSFVVLIAVILAIYAVYIHRKNPLIDLKDADQRRPSHGEGTEISCVVGCDAGAIDHHVDDAENGSDRNFHHGPGSRRGSMESNGSDVKKSRQVRRSSTDGSYGMIPQQQGVESGRRASMGALGGPNVSRQYKLAAIQHMNQISQTGRHDYQ